MFEFYKIDVENACHAAIKAKATDQNFYITLIKACNNSTGQYVTLTFDMWLKIERYWI